MKGFGSECARVRRWLPLFVGEDLPDDLEVPIEEHLLVCERCAAYEDALRGDRVRLAAFARRERQHALPARIADGQRFWAELQVAIAQAGPEMRRETPLPGPRIHHLPTWRRALRVGLAAAAILAAVVIYRPFAEPPDTTGTRELRTDLPVHTPGSVGSAVVPALPVDAAPSDLAPPAERDATTYPLDGWRRPRTNTGEVLDF
ncbi:MAG: zf-HC2 domain-containing protein [Planctomycetota bacterium]|nr:MAG: zf-HC2 domain-containing protein [Planctomycetota bacterium]